jgi:hypothetical protein
MSRKQTVVRMLLALYVPITALLYFGLVYPPSRHAEKLSKTRDEMMASQTHQTAISEAARIKGRQVKGLAQAIAQFYAKSRRFDKASVPVFVGGIARNTQVALTRLNVDSIYRVSGCSFFKAEAEMRGSFANLRAFLTELDSARIGPARGTAGYALVATFSVMLRTMPTEGVLAAMGGGADLVAPGEEQQRDADPDKAEAGIPQSGAPAPEVSVPAHDS